MSHLDQLTKRQRAIYDFIRDKIRNRGYGPTVREIGHRFKISSPNGVMCHLKALEKKGLITREPNMSRAIQLAAEPIEERGLPLAGRVAAGVMHEAIEQKERIDFAGMFDSSKKSLFVLEVSGDSMIDAHISDGDYVIVRRQRTAQPGQMVIAQTEDGEALRNDEEYAYVSVWEYTGVGNEPVLHKEPLAFENVQLATRSYK